jgi:hypothetical protein
VLPSTLLVTFTESPRKSLSLTSSSFIYGQGRTSSSVLDLSRKYEHWTYVCDSRFFLAMAEWNVDGDGESLIVSTHIIDWWRPSRSRAQRLPDGDFPSRSRLFFATPSVGFPYLHPPYSTVPACCFGIAEDRATSPHHLYFLFFS